MKSEGTLHIQPLDPDLHDRAGFDCGVVELNDYLAKQARKEVASGVSACFVATWDPQASTVIGYYTLSAATIARTALPPSLLKKLPRYSELPATLLGRLAVASTEAGRGLGRKLLFSAMTRSLSAANEVGSLAIVTDPKDESAREFYEKFGFQALDERRLFSTMKTVESVLSAR